MNDWMNTITKCWFLSKLCLTLSSCSQDPGLHLCLPAHNHLHEVPQLNTQPLGFAPTIQCLIKLSKTLFQSITYNGSRFPCLILVQTALFGTERSAAAGPSPSIWSLRAPSLGSTPLPHAKCIGCHPASASATWIPSSFLKHKSNCFSILHPAIAPLPLE